MIDFFFGIIIGFIIGGVLVHMAHEYFDSMLSQDEQQDQQWLGRKK
jgi:hypothetical protein